MEPLRTMVILALVGDLVLGTFSVYDTLHY